MSRERQERPDYDASNETRASRARRRRGGSLRIAEKPGAGACTGAEKGENRADPAFPAAPPLQPTPGMKVHLRRLHEQVIVLTGATSGIGLVTARMAARRGARLVLAARSEGPLRELAAEIESRGGHAAIAVADVGREEDVERIARTAIETFGGFDTWINDAGVSIYGALMDVSIDDMRRLFETNFWGLVYGSRIAARHLRARGGAIVNIGSALSDRAIPVQGIYCASKHAVKGFTDALRMELEKEAAPISISLVKPSAIDTPYRQSARNYLDVEPLNPPPVYAPETVAEAILHCAEHPVRDVFVGAAGKTFSSLGHHAPRFTDTVMKATLFALQRTDQPSDPAAHRGLTDPSSALRERGGYPGHVAESSLYTRASLHPLVAGAFLAGAGLLLAASAKRGASRTGSRRNKGSEHRPN